MTPEQFEKYKGGVCWDYVLYEAAYFKKRFPNVKYKAFYHCNVDNINNPTHTFLLFYMNHKVYWFESAWDKFKGIFEFNNEDEALCYITNMLYEDLDDNVKNNVIDFFTVQFNPLDTKMRGMNCVEYMEYMSMRKEYAFNRAITVIPQSVTESNINTDNIVMEPTLESSMKSNIDKDYKSKGKKNLSSFSQKELSLDIIKKYKPMYKSLRHVDEKDDTRIVFFDKNSLVGYVCTNKESDNLIWITALEITDSYKGYGLGLQLLDYAVKKLNASALGVAKDNKIAIQMYENYGFKISDESKKEVESGNKINYRMYLESVANESYIFNSGDIYYNKDKFDNGEINLCFIGADSEYKKSFINRNKVGKFSSTEHIVLDDIICIADRYDVFKLKKCGDLIYSYFTGRGRKFFTKSKTLMRNNVPTSEYEDELYPDFIYYTMKYAKSHPTTRIIIEGLWLYCTAYNKMDDPWFDPSEFDDYAFYIKNLPIPTYKVRVVKTKFKNSDSGTQRFRAFLDNIKYNDWKWYFINDERVNRFKDYFEEKSKEVIATEACKDVATARKFVSEVGKLAKKYNANYFVVTDGASGTSNGNGGISDPAVKNARDGQIEWEKKNQFDPDEDWKKGIPSKMNTYYRITYDGIGIYEAFHQELNKRKEFGVWKNFINSDKTSWLPHPPLEYKPNYRSYFTQKGYDTFNKKAMPLIKRYLDESRIDIKKYQYKGNVVYSDPYQIIIDSELKPVTESMVATEGILDIPQKIFNFFAGNTDKEFILQSWKDKINGSSNLIGGPPMKSKYTTLSKVIIDNKAGIISIQHINIPLLIQRMRETYEEKRIDLLFDRTYRGSDIAKFNKKQISRAKMKVTSLTVPVFFALELVILFRDLYNRYYTPAYSHIANEIYKNTWLSSTDKAQKPSIDLSRLNNLNHKYALKDYQKEFIESYPALRTQLGLRGYYLAFEQGLGKTLTATALAEVLGAQKVYIICPNTLTSVWYNETKDYFNGKYQSIICGKNDKNPSKDTKFFIVNQESIKNMYKYVDSNAKSMIIVDESHNFRNYESLRAKELLELKNKLQPSDILMMSGTPIKATPNEIVPALMMLDDKFTEYAAKVYNSCFKLDTYLAMDVVRERFGQVIYRKTKTEVLTLPDKNTSDIKVKIGHADKYIMHNVKRDVKEIFEAKYAELAQANKKVIVFFNESILKYSLATKRDTMSYMNKVANISNVDNSVSMGQFHELDQEFIDTFITNYIQPNPKCNAAMLKDIREAERKLLLIRRSAMGTAIGAIYPKYRAEMFQAMYDQNKKLFTNMIENNPKKTVIFSQSLPVIKHICEDLNASGIPTVKVIGGTSAMERADIIDKFKNDELVKVICATSQSMSTGVTLTEANQMFFFGPPWRAADYMQAQDRIHRIGQTDTVNIYNVILDTVEMNLSDRMDNILKWSGEMASAAIDDL